MARLAGLQIDRLKVCPALGPGRAGSWTIPLVVGWWSQEPNPRNRSLLKPMSLAAEPAWCRTPPILRQIPRSRTCRGTHGMPDWAGRVDTPVAAASAASPRPAPGALPSRPDSRHAKASRDQAPHDPAGPQPEAAYFLIHSLVSILATHYPSCKLANARSKTSIHNETSCSLHYFTIPH